MASGQCAAEGGRYGPGEYLSLIELLLNQVLQAAGICGHVPPWLVLVVGHHLPGVADDLVHHGLQVSGLRQLACP
jgi:hypothetical protein